LLRDAFNCELDTLDFLGFWFCEHSARSEVNFLVDCFEMRQLKENEWNVILETWGNARVGFLGRNRGVCGLAGFVSRLEEFSSGLEELLSRLGGIFSGLS
jgi:hypothetical protein